MGLFGYKVVAKFMCVVFLTLVHPDSALSCLQTLPCLGLGPFPGSTWRPPASFPSVLFNLKLVPQPLHVLTLLPEATGGVWDMPSGYFSICELGQFGYHGSSVRVLSAALSAHACAPCGICRILGHGALVLFPDIYFFIFKCLKDFFNIQHYFMENPFRDNKGYFICAINLL